MYIKLKSLVPKILDNGTTLTIENREHPGYKDYGFPGRHAEVDKYRNKVDGDLWDVMIFGYEKPFQYEDKYETNKLIGIVFVEGGNHKLVFKIPKIKGFKQKRFETQLKKFMKNYHKETKLGLQWITMKELKKKI